jgi:hypothetical protein
LGALLLGALLLGALLLGVAPEAPKGAGKGLKTLG